MYAKMKKLTINGKNGLPGEQDFFQFVLVFDTGGKYER
jgi:hypothetical protein